MEESREIWFLRRGSKCVCRCGWAFSFYPECFFVVVIWEIAQVLKKSLKRNRDRWSLPPEENLVQNITPLTFFSFMLHHSHCSPLMRRKKKNEDSHSFPFFSFFFLACTKKEGHLRLWTLGKLMQALFTGKWEAVIHFPFFRDGAKKVGQKKSTSWIFSTKSDSVFPSKVLRKINRRKKKPSKWIYILWRRRRVKVVQGKGLLCAN